MSLIETRFRDLAGREMRARTTLSDKLSKFQEMEKRKRVLRPQEQDERDLIAAILAEIKSSRSNKAPEVCDPLFVGARKLFNDGEGMLAQPLMSHKNGVLVFDSAADDGSIVMASLTLGLLIVDGADAPPVNVVDQASGGGSGQPASTSGSARGKTIVPDTADPAWKRLTRAFFEAIGEARGVEDLAALVLPILALEGDPDGPQGAIVPNVDAEEFARVMRELHKRGVTADENQLRRRVNEALDRVQSVGADGPFNDVGINLPDLDEVTDNNIVAENVRLMGPMIVSAMFDELKAFQVVDLLVEHFQRGTLPIGSGEAGKLLYRYWREAPNRMSEMERRTFYATTMGVPGGEADGFVNREFNDLWLRFVSSVSEFVRQAEVDKLLRTSIPSPVSHQQVRKAARDLAGNLSLHGYGMAYYAALELQDQIKFIIKLLGDREIRAAYGARDMWQVIDQVATLELGGAKTSSRYKTLATCGTIITTWLANNVHRINSDTITGPLLDVDEIRFPPARLSGQKATTHPNDYDLVNACELWLADTGTSDMRVEELSQPREAPVQTSRPVQVPAVVRDMLDGMGDLGIGFGHRQ